MRVSEFFNAHSPWQAAFLLASGIPLVKVYRNEYGRVRFLFRNTDDLAYQRSRDWYNAADCTVNAVAYMAAYKDMIRALDRARNGEETFGNDIQEEYCQRAEAQPEAEALEHRAC